MTACVVIGENESSSVSVIICAYTRDRWVELSACIRSAQAQQPAVSEIIVVVDHNSDLETEIRTAFPSVVVTASRGKKGLSAARNTGIALAHGRILVFLDDDAYAAPDCIERMVQHFGRVEIAGVTARVVPEWTSTKPKWFPDEFLWIVGCTHYDACAGPVRNLLGAGMCLPREIFESAGGFDGALGRTRSWLPMGGEETELCLRAVAADPSRIFYYEPQALVHHVVRADRLTWKYFVMRCLAEGLSKARLRAIAPRTQTLSVERSYVTGVLARAAFRDGKKALVAGDLGALQRSLAIVLGLGCAATGYVSGRLADVVRGGATQQPRTIPAIGGPRFSSDPSRSRQETHVENA